MPEDKTYHILVIDDEESIRESLAIYLEDFGFEVSTADDGEKGLRSIQELKPDVTIVDMRLGIMDGNDFIIEAHKINPATKFLIHTGSVEFILKPALKKIGINEKHIFTKPVRDMATIVNATNELLGINK